MSRRLLGMVFLFGCAAFAQNGQPLRLTGAVLTRTCSQWNMNAEPETDFLITDPYVCLNFTATGGRPGEPAHRVA